MTMPKPMRNDIAARRHNQVREQATMPKLSQ